MSEHYNASNVNLEAYGLTVTGQVRKANEDSCGFSTVPNGDLFVVCDGMGGHVGGATASKIAVEQIIEHFKAQYYQNVYQALFDALCRANIQILGEAAANPSLKGMGTTACIVLIQGDDAYIAHVGDSRIYLYEAAKKRLFRITKDHSLVQALVDQGQLDDRDAEHHPQKNVILKALGTREVLKPEVYTCPVQPASGDIFLICSDGLSGMVDDNGIEAILSSDSSIEEKTDQLVANANVPGKGLDNITAQLIKVIKSPYPSSNHPDHNPRWRNEGMVVDDAIPTQDINQEQGSAPQPKKRMRPIWVVLIIAGAMSLLLGIVGVVLWSICKESDPNKIEQQIADLKQETSDINGEITILDDTIASLNDYVKQCRVKNDTATASFKESIKNLGKFEKDKNKKLDKVKELEDRITEKQEKLNKIQGSSDSNEEKGFIWRLFHGNGDQDENSETQEQGKTKVDVITIGRNTGNDVIIKDEAASRYHLQIVEYDDGSYHLIDFNSTNGTYVNGNRVDKEVVLNEGDFVRIGDTMLPWKTYFSSGFVSQAQEGAEELTAPTGEHKSKKSMEYKPAEPVAEPQAANTFAILGFVFAFLIPLLGLIFSIVGIGNAKKMGGKGKGLAIAGLIISIISVVIVILYIVLIFGT